jgi:hypothetical protein
MLAQLIEANQSDLGIGYRSYDTTTDPVIGIITQDLPSDLIDDPKFMGKTTYIMDGYVNYVEAFGARVVPIISEESDEDTKAKLEVLNGVLIPGGSEDYWFTKKGQYVYDYIVQQNKDGNFYPLWGTCMGFEYLAAFASDYDMDVLSDQSSHNVELTLDWLTDPAETKMFGDAADRVQDY